MSSDESEDSFILLEVEPSTIQLHFSPPSSPESQTPLEDEDAPQPIANPRILCVTSLYGKGENFEHWAEQNGLEEWGSCAQQCLVSEEGLHAKVNEEEGCIHSTDGQIQEGNSGDDQDKKGDVRDVQQVIVWKEPPKEQERGNKQIKEEKGNERVDEEKGNVQVKEEKRVNEDGEDRAGGEEAKTLQGEETSNRCEVSRSIGIQGKCRTTISSFQKEVLKALFQRGMTSKGSSLVMEAREATGLSQPVVENWIRNHRSVVHADTKKKLHTSKRLTAYNIFLSDFMQKGGSLQDVAGRWATISEDKKEKLRKEAEQRNNSLEFEKDRPMKIKRQMNVKGIMKSMQSKIIQLEKLGVESSILLYNPMDLDKLVHQIGSKRGKEFLEAQGVIRSFSQHFTGRP